MAKLIEKLKKIGYASGASSSGRPMTETDDDMSKQLPEAIARSPTKRSRRLYAKI